MYCVLLCIGMRRTNRGDNSYTENVQLMFSTDRRSKAQTHTHTHTSSECVNILNKSISHMTADLR